MAETEHTKICPLCAETIKAAAKLCPNCRTRQSRFGLWQAEILAGLVWMVWIGVALAVCALMFPGESGFGSRTFARHRSDLLIVRTSLERVERVGSRPDFILTGYVTNQGKFPWRVQNLEARFLDAAGNMLDVQHTDISGPTFVVQPKQEHAFRASLGRVAFTNDAVVQSVRVHRATDGNYPEKSD
jgi:hypothetical protein